MQPLRLKDWNSSLGVIAFAAIVVCYSTYAFTHPDFLEEMANDRRILMRLFPYVGPLIALWYLYKQVWFVEFGERISFQRSFGRKTYDWNELKSVSIEVMKKRIFFFPVTHEFMNFRLSGPSGVGFHSYRVSKTTKDQIFALIRERSPETKLG